MKGKDGMSFTLMINYPFYYNELKSKTTVGLKFV